MQGKVVFIGCGKIATQSAITLHQDGIEVLGVRRDTNKLPHSLPSYAADVMQPESLTFLQTHTPETIVYSLAAQSFDEQSYINAYVTGLQNVIAACDLSKLKRLIFVSSTAVYHQNDGSIVDETSATQPKRFNGQIMLQAEQLALSTDIGACLRLSGIYGSGRTRMIDRVRNGQCTDESSNSYTNRIHATDCSAVLVHLVKQDALPDIIIGSDSNPGPAHEVETYIAKQLEIEKQYAQHNPIKPVRIAGSKRCSNRLLLDTGYRFTYPDYRAGYKQLIKELND